MSDNKNDQVLVALFSNVDAADTAVEALKQWDKANDDIKLGAVGTLIATPEGEIKTHVGHKAGKGAKTGAVVGVIAGVLSGGVTVIGGLVGGAVAGGVLGAFFKKSTHLTEDEIAKIGEELKSGKAAVVVTCDDFEVEATKAQFVELGGEVWTYQVPDDALAGIEPVVNASADEAFEEQAMERASAAGQATGGFGIPAAWTPPPVEE